MRESRTYGSVRGALSNGCPYRVEALLPIWYRSRHELLVAFGELAFIQLIKRSSQPCINKGMGRLDER